MGNTNDDRPTLPWDSVADEDHDAIDRAMTPDDDVQEAHGAAPQQAPEAEPIAAASPIDEEPAEPVDVADDAAEFAQVSAEPADIAEQGGRSVAEPVSNEWIAPEPAIVADPQIVVAPPTIDEGDVHLPIHDAAQANAEVALEPEEGGPAPTTLVDVGPVSSVGAMSETDAACAAEHADMTLSDAGDAPVDADTASGADALSADENSAPGDAAFSVHADDVENQPVEAADHVVPELELTAIPPESAPSLEAVLSIVAPRAPERLVPVIEDEERELAVAPTGGSWTIPLMCAGIALIACCLLIPQADELRRLVYQRQALQQDLEYIERQVAINDEFLKRIADDPTLAQRLAQRQMKKIRQGTAVLHLRGEGEPDGMSPFLLVNVAPPPPLPPYRPLGGKLADLCRSPKPRLYLLGGGMLLIATGLVLGGAPKESAGNAPAGDSSEGVANDHDAPQQAEHDAFAAAEDAHGGDDSSPG